MKTKADDMLPPKILLVDDEEKIHASLHLRLHKEYQVISYTSGHEALDALSKIAFDLCFVDLRMPILDGFSFVKEARLRDSSLGIVILSGFDSAENLKASIPLHVLDFIGKPFPGRSGLEARIPSWIDYTRRQRSLSRSLEETEKNRKCLSVALEEREAEIIMSEAARSAIIRITDQLTTINAHLSTAVLQDSKHSYINTHKSHLPSRNVDMAKLAADVATEIAREFFNSSYSDRHNSPAEVGSGLRHACEVARKIVNQDLFDRVFDHQPLPFAVSIPAVSGGDFLKMMASLLGIVLQLSISNSTVRIKTEVVARLEFAMKNIGVTNGVWLNRKHALISQPGIVIHIQFPALPSSCSIFESWLEVEDPALGLVTAAGLVAGLKKAKGTLGVLKTADRERLSIVVALPTCS